MTKKGHTEEQIIAALKQHESGEKAWISRARDQPGDVLPMKKQYAGLGVQERRETRQLREENSRLKRLVADLSLDQQILQEIVSKSTEASSAIPASELGKRGISDCGAACSTRSRGGLEHIPLSSSIG